MDDAVARGGRELPLLSGGVTGERADATRNRIEQVRDFK